MLWKDYNPINPHGRRAKMPTGGQSPFRNPDGSNVQLYRVHVDTREGESVAVTPALIGPVASDIHATIRDAIKSGIRREWSNPHIRPAF